MRHTYISEYTYLYDLKSQTSMRTSGILKLGGWFRTRESPVAQSNASSVHGHVKRGATVTRNALVVSSIYRKTQLSRTAGTET